MGPWLGEPRRHQLGPACSISKAEDLELDMGATQVWLGHVPAQQSHAKSCALSLFSCRSFLAPKYRCVAHAEPFLSLSDPHPIPSYPRPNPTSQPANHIAIASHPVHRHAHTQNRSHVSRQSQIRRRPRCPVPRGRPPRIPAPPRLTHLSAPLLAHRNRARIPAPIRILRRGPHAAPAAIHTPQPPHDAAEPPRASALRRSLAALEHEFGGEQRGPQRVCVS
jgi:hypothetical protein